MKERYFLIEILNYQTLHKRQFKEKLIQKQIAFLSQKKSSSHRTATANPRHVQVNVTVNEAVNSNNF